MTDAPHDGNSAQTSRTLDAIGSVAEAMLSLDLPADARAQVYLIISMARYGLDLREKPAP